MSAWIKIPLYIIIGATVISLFESAQTAPVIGSLTNGFAGVIAAMRGQSAPSQAASSNSGTSAPNAG